jgi:CheY-like chemotaxis protein
VPYTLLLADDSVTIQRVIELTFADEDVTVVAVSDGDQAIERLEASPPDIVLADIGMPGKNGYEVAQYMRRSPKLAHIPVVLLTGAFEPVDQARANDAGCDGVLAKPFEPQLVIGRVKELLARARPAPDVQTPEAVDNIWAPPLADQRPATPFVDPPSPAAGSVANTELNDYFDRLDAAFSSLTSGAPAPAAAPVSAIADPTGTQAETEIDWFGTKAAETGSTEPWDLPAPALEEIPAELPSFYALPEPETAVSDAPAAASDTMEDRFSPIEESMPVEPAFTRSDDFENAASQAAVAERIATFTPAPAAAHVPPAAPALELPLPNPPPLPALADAFAALLAAEQGETPSAAGSLWPTASAPPAPSIDDEVIEDVVRRVLERLSDTVVRDAVADIASQVAERLVREEIARIKAAIK